MPKFVVKTPIRIAKKDPQSRQIMEKVLKPGDEIEITAELAATMPWAVEEKE